MHTISIKTGPNDTIGYTINSITGYIHAQIHYMDIVCIIITRLLE